MDVSCDTPPSIPAAQQVVRMQPACVRTDLDVARIHLLERAITAIVLCIFFCGLPVVHVAKHQQFSPLSRW